MKDSTAYCVYELLLGVDFSGLGMISIVDIFQALEMIHNIRDAFNEILEASDWMDSETKVVAKAKVSARTTTSSFITFAPVFSRLYTDTAVLNARPLFTCIQRLIGIGPIHRRSIGHLQLLSFIVYIYCYWLARFKNSNRDRVILLARLNGPSNVFLSVFTYRPMPLTSV